MQYIEHPRAHPLVGRAFHSVDWRGRTHWQGEIVADCGQGYFLVQLFEWGVGAETTQHILTLDELSSKYADGTQKFRIFKNIEDANVYMETWARSRDESIDKREQQEAAN